MKLKVIGTGSSGNCYILTDSDGQKFFIEAGLKKDDIIKGADYKLNKVVGGFVSHKHYDHARSLEAIRSYGGNWFAPYEALGQTSGLAGQYQVDGFANRSREGRWFHSNGDGSECPCYGAVIRHKEMGCLLYLTDAELCPWNFKNWKLDYILIECNYQDAYIDTEQAKASHVYGGHMELQTVIDFIKANQTENLKKVIICHMSATNADPKEMQAAIEAETGIEVEIAEAGKIIKLGE
jgi:phosphoribosyl 1,2-cyclic phosphodiesterase